MGPERVRFGSFSRRRTLYLLPFNTIFLFLRSVRCAVHVALQPRCVIKRPLAQFSEKSKVIKILPEYRKRLSCLSCRLSVSSYTTGARNRAALDSLSQWRYEIG